MKRRDFRENKSPLVMIIPMIDIMLFLLIFFMLSTIYMVQTNNFNVNLPRSEISGQEAKKNIVSVTVTEDGNLFYGEEKILVQQLPQKISQTLSADRETVFILMGDRSAKYEKVVNILEVLKKSGVKHVSIATEAK